ncbi:MAG: hypothetical protein QF903_09120 [Planctomycetota bacterium]|nr:hypothetical protein [Planctomycetota bacterium]MDP6763454.1 hypothetical protein [Planctomycetota bacterium]MDP6989626.1 hypothetical protein [Planctomycetota bacterium]
MNASTRWIGRAMLAVWLTWAAGLQAWLADSARLAAVTPDLSMILVACLAGALARRELPVLLALAFLARQSFSVDPAAATLAGLLAVGGLVLALGSVVDVAGPLGRGLATLLAVGGFAFWVEAVRVVRGAAPEGFETGGVAALAAASGLAALALGGALVRLPGLPPLGRERW